jgi:glycosyltransferase involved in cell wall biosynthesis
MALRILHCIFTRSLFGSERYAADLARFQKDAGHDVHFAVHPKGRIAEVIVPGIEVQPDIIHCHLSAACKTVGAIRPRPPAVASLHVGFKPGQHAKLNGVVALTDSDAGRIRDYDGLVRRIWNWAPEARDPGADARATIRNELGISDATFLIGFVGRLHPSKDPQTLVRAFRAAKLDDAVLALAGEGPLRADVERLTAGDGRIKILGYRTDAPALYRAFDLFVLPSRFEQVPLAALEAMQVGLPLIISDIESLTEFVPSPPARVFRMEDHEGLARLMEAAVGDGRQRLSYDMMPFDRAGQCAKVMAFYGDVLSRRG